MRQDTPVNYDGKGNAQALINVARYGCVLGQLIEKPEDIWNICKVSIKEKGETELSNVMVPNCVYRGGCPSLPRVVIGKLSLNGAIQKRM